MSNHPLNLKVIQRHDKTIESIITSVSYVVLYDHDGTTWKKAGTEGSLFVCSRSTAKPPLSLLILNRSSPINWELALTGDIGLDIQGKVIMLLDTKMPNAKAIGLWVHEASEAEKLLKELIDLRNTQRTPDYVPPQPQKLQQPPKPATPPISSPIPALIQPQILGKVQQPSNGSMAFNEILAKLSSQPPPTTQSRSVVPANSAEPVLPSLPPQHPPQQQQQQKPNNGSLSFNDIMARLKIQPPPSPSPVHSASATPQATPEPSSLSNSTINTPPIAAISGLPKTKGVELLDMLFNNAASPSAAAAPSTPPRQNSGPLLTSATYPGGSSNGALLNRSTSSEPTFADFPSDQQTSAHQFPGTLIPSTSASTASVKKQHKKPVASPTVSSSVPTKKGHNKRENVVSNSLTAGKYIPTTSAIVPAEGVSSGSIQNAILGEVKKEEYGLTSQSLGKREFVREVLSLIHTNPEFVERLYERYLAEGGG